MATPVILEVAANGVTTRAQNPAVPREPKEIAEDALACFAAGAAIVHTHTHDPALPPVEGAALYLEAYRPILARRPDALLYPTVAPGPTIEPRYGHTELLAEAGAIRCGALDTGSVNLGAALSDGWPMPMDFVYTNSPNDIRFMANVCREHGLGPSVAVFQGAQAYVSPSWYPSKRAHGKVVPTWNYAVVHAHGVPRAIESRDEVLAIVTRLTQTHEADSAVPWAVSDAPADYIDQMLKAIIGIEIPIERWVGKWKASQNRSAPDRLGTVAGLQQRGDAPGLAMAALVPTDSAKAPG